MTSRSPTRETPFMLAFGTEAIILVEARIPSSRTQAFDEKQNPQDLKANLNLIEEA